MELLWVFILLAPLALALLFFFAAHIDPLSGRWRKPSRRTRQAARAKQAARPAPGFIAYNESPSNGS
jgi:hypothetical protein